MKPNRWYISIFYMKPNICSSFVFPHEIQPCSHSQNHSRSVFRRPLGHVACSQLLQLMFSLPRPLAPSMHHILCKPSMHHILCKPSMHHILCKPSMHHTFHASHPVQANPTSWWYGQTIEVSSDVQLPKGRQWK